MNNHLGKTGDYSNIYGHLVDAKIAEICYRGEKKTAIKIFDLPALFAYSDGINQITRIKKRLLDTTMNEETAKIKGPQKTRYNSKNFVLLKRYIAQEISAMKGTTTRSNRMRYTTIAENIDLQDATPKQLRSLRDDVDYYLTLLQSMGEIKGFAKYKDGRALAGVEVYL